MRTFYAVLGNTLVATFTNMYVWFAVTFWLYLETRSVLATSVMAGVYLVITSVSGFFLGSIVDRYRKWAVLAMSSLLSLGLYLVAAALFFAVPREEFRDPANPLLWVFVTLCLFGAITGNVRTIGMMTLVTLLVPEGRRDRANGLVGTANGIAFLMTSMVSGITVGQLGMSGVMIIALGMSVVVLLHLATVRIAETRPVRAEGQAAAQFVDVRGTLKMIVAVPGLLGLIFFSAFNNFLGGVFMALMDAYGLELVSVEAWGFIWGVLSVGFIVGGLLIARFGLGVNPLRTLFLVNVVCWIVCIVFTIQSWVWLLMLGMFIWLTLMPMVEASEQTILQKVIVPERQGRVFGLAQSIEMAASPLTAFFVGPLAQFVFIPLMTDGAGAELIGSWYGTGVDRGIAALFSIAGLAGLLVTLAGMRTGAFRALSAHYLRAPALEEGGLAPSSATG